MNARQKGFFPALTLSPLCLDYDVSKCVGDLQTEELSYRYGPTAPFLVVITLARISAKQIEYLELEPETDLISSVSYAIRENGSVADGKSYRLKKIGYFPHFIGSEYVNFNNAE